MTKKKKEETKKEVDSNFNLDEALLTVNRYLKPGFIEYIQGKDVTTQKQFDELYNEFKELR